MSDRKAKLLKKYAGELKEKKVSMSGDGLHIRDNEIEFNDSVSSNSDESESKQRKRIRSDSENDQQQAQLKINIEEDKKSKRVSKGIRKAFGLKKGEDADDFLDAIKIEGLEVGELDEYLKKNKGAITIQSKKERKEKKKREKELYVKLQENEEKSSSDLEIPQQARTIYRNKDGTIRQYSQAKEKQMKQQEILSKLGEWQKGMERQQSEEDQIVDIWDDPARRWQAKSRHPLRCPFDGYTNRFNIKPGFRWDGVIRGNGFENKYLQQMNLRKAKQQQESRNYMKHL